MHLIRPWRCHIEESSIRTWQCLWFGYDEAELESALLCCGGVFDLAAVMCLIQPWRSWVEKPRTLPWQRRWSAMTKPSQENFDSVATSSQFGHDDGKSTSHQCGRSNVSDSSVTKVSLRIFYLATNTPSIVLRWIRNEEPLIPPRRPLRFGYNNAKSETLLLSHNYLFNQRWGEGNPLTSTRFWMNEWEVWVLAVGGKAETRVRTEQDNVIPVPTF